LNGLALLVRERHFHKQSCLGGRYNNNDGVLPSRRNDLNRVVRINFRNKWRLVHKVAEGMSLVLSGLAPLFTCVGLKLASQAAKGIKGIVNHYRRRSRR